MILAAMGALLVMLGAGILFLASPHQLLLRKPPARPIALGSGASAILAGTLLLLGWAGPATAIFIAMTAAMLVWTLLPLAAAWLRQAREENE